MSTFSPRDVQARVRAGESAQEVSADTGWPLDKVERYAEPLLQERAYIAEQAQSVEVRRSGGSVTLLQTAQHALGSPDQHLTWDAFRRDDGRWIVIARYGVGDKARQAQWTYDPAGRNLHPLDDQARALMGVAHEAVTPAAVEVITEALDLARDDAPTDGTSALADDIERSRPHLVAVPDPAGDVDDHGASDPAPASATHPTEIISTPAPTPPAPPAATNPTPPAPKPKPRKGGRRASVPSWDEILFGTGRSED